MGGAGRSTGSFCIDGHHLGPKVCPLYGVERWPQIRGFYSVGTKVSVRYREGGHSSGVVVKRSFTVIL